jgi:hypothetical protein
MLSLVNSSNGATTSVTCLSLPIGAEMLVDGRNCDAGNKEGSVRSLDLAFNNGHHFASYQPLVSHCIRAFLLPRVLIVIDFVAWCANTPAGSTEQ